MINLILGQVLVSTFLVICINFSKCAQNGLHNPEKYKDSLSFSLSVKLPLLKKLIKFTEMMKPEKTDKLVLRWFSCKI